MSADGAQRRGVAALLLGATGIGFAPILVRWSETGPVATAFFRILFALPVLWIWFAMAKSGASTENSPPAGPARSRRGVLAFCLAGFCFAGDMAFWNWSVHLTSVANATLLTNLAPILVMLGARWLFGERVTRRLLIGMGLAIAGGALLVGASFQLSLRRVLGDLLGLAGAVFYAGYLLSVKHLRRASSAVEIMAKSGLASCVFLLPAAVMGGETLVAHSARGWGTLLALALICHVGGQGLIAYALAHLGASFSSIGLLFQALVASILAALILGESLSAWQYVGGLGVLAGIALASASIEDAGNSGNGRARTI